MDDCLTGANTLEDTVSLRNELNSLLGEAKMKLRKWRASSVEILDTIPAPSTCRVSVPWQRWPHKGGGCKSKWTYLPSPHSFVRPLALYGGRGLSGRGGCSGLRLNQACYLSICHTPNHTPLLFPTMCSNLFDLSCSIKIFAVELLSLKSA